MFRNLLWILGLVAILVFINWLFGAMGLDGVIDVNNPQQVLNLVGFFIVGLGLLFVYTVAVGIRALKSR